MQWTRDLTIIGLSDWGCAVLCRPVLCADIQAYTGIDIELGKGYRYKGSERSLIVYYVYFVWFLFNSKIYIYSQNYVFVVNSCRTTFDGLMVWKAGQCVSMTQSADISDIICKNCITVPIVPTLPTVPLEPTVPTLWPLLCFSYWLNWMQDIDIIENHCQPIGVRLGSAIAVANHKQMRSGLVWSGLRWTRGSLSKYNSSDRLKTDRQMMAISLN